jgi:hypothetical protein
MINPAPIQDNTLDRSGRFSPRWVLWFQSVFRAVTGKEPFPLASYTVAGLPAAADFTGHVVYVSNEAGGATLAFSDGTNWRRAQDRAIVS